METPDITSLLEDIQNADARDGPAQTALHGRIKTLRDALSGGAAREITAYLDNAVMLTHYLARMNGLSPEDVKAIVVRLINTVLANRSAPEPIQSSFSQTPEEPRPQEMQWKLSRDNLTMPKEEKVVDKMLGEILIQQKLVTEDQLAEALMAQRAAGMRIGEAIVKIGAASWDEVQRAIKVQDTLRQSIGSKVSF